MITDSNPASLEMWVLEPVRNNVNVSVRVRVRARACERERRVKV